MIKQALVQDEAETPAKTGWLSRLKNGLKKSSTKIGDGVAAIFGRRTLDDETLEELEELLIASDMGVTTSGQIVKRLRETKLPADADEQEIKQALADIIAGILQPVARPVDIGEETRPYVIAVVGVNGNGKTTTVGKMANLLRSNGWNVLIAACDTFRAAAVEQLVVWGERAQCEVYTAEPGADPGSVAFRAYEEAKRRGFDIVMIDTAGRLHNKANLMAELQKIVKVLKKLDNAAPHSVIQILDATTGQNAHAQVETFKEMVNVTGLVVTKLDGTAKGGVVVALADKYKLPIHAVGVGESMEDLHEFEAADFAKGLVGIS